MSNPILTNSAATDKNVLQRYLQLPQPDDKIMATYVWIDGTEENVRGMLISSIACHKYAFTFDLFFS